MFSVRKQLGSSSTPQQLSNSLHLHTMFPQSGSPSSFRYPSAHPTKESRGPIFSTPRYWSKHSMTWSRMSGSSSPISSWLSGPYYWYSTPFQARRSRNSSKTVAHQLVFPIPCVPSILFSWFRTTRSTLSGSFTNPSLTSSRTQEDVKMNVSLSTPRFITLIYFSRAST